MKEKEKNLNAILRSNVFRDAALSYFSDTEKEKLQCFGEVKHLNLNVLHAFFAHFQVNSNSNVSLLACEENSSIHLLQTKDSLLLFSDKEILSPSLFAKAMAVLLYRFYVFSLSTKNTINMDSFFIQDLQVLLSSMEKVSSATTSSFQMEYQEIDGAILFKQLSLQEDLYSLIKSMASLYIEIALPLSKIGAEKLTIKSLVPLSKLEERMQFYKQYEGKIKLKLFKIKPFVIDGKEYIIDFTEKMLDEKNIELIPLFEVNSSQCIVPTMEQLKAILLTMDDKLQRKIYVSMVKIIGGFSPLSYGFYDDVFFSKEIVIQMGQLIESGLYYGQDNLAIHSSILDYFQDLGSHNKEDAISLEYTREE